MKKFKAWLLNTKEEADNVLFPPLITENMLATRQFELKDGQITDLGIATLNDLDAIIRIQEACYDGEAPWGRIAVNNELRNKNKAFFLMLYLDSYAVAFIGMSSRQNSLHVTNIATDPRYQRNGIGTFLMHVVMDIAHQLEKERITLEVRTSNIGAKRLYRSLGFVDSFIKRNYYHNNGEDALEMVYHVGAVDE